jgi:thioredoxin reductase
VSNQPHDLDVLIIGGGPAGLSAAIELRRRGVANVVVAERETSAGGVPLHCFHRGFGLVDLHRSLTGPRYAKELVQRSLEDGVTILTGTSARPLEDGLQLVSSEGLRGVHPRRVILATGARERSRAARLIPGDRPAGVFTTGQLQRWVHEKHFAVGQRALVVGAEHVSFSAVLTLRDAGVATVAMVSEHARQQSLRGTTLLAKSLLRVPVLTSSKVIGVNGRGRITSVDVQDLVTGRVSTLAVDTVVLSGDWIPDNECARSLGVALSSSTHGPIVDGLGATSTVHVYAAGNVVQPAETASVAARRGRWVGAAVADSLARGDDEALTPRIEVTWSDVIDWVVPQRVSTSAAPDRCFVRLKQFSRARTLVIRQDNRVLARTRLRHGTPNRGLSFSGEWICEVNESGSPVVIDLE